MSAEYTPEIADIICGRLAAGQILREALRGTGVLPHDYYEWRRVSEEFAKATENARVEGSHAYVDDAIGIADDCPEDKDAVMRAKLRVETRLRMAALLNPKRYALGFEKGGGGTSVQVLVVTGVPEPVAQELVSTKPEPLRLVSSKPST